MHTKLYNVINNEDAYLCNDIENVDYSVSIEEARNEIIKTDNFLNLIEYTDIYENKISDIIAFENNIYNCDKNTAKLSLVNTYLLAKEQGFKTTISIEDDIIDPTHSLVVSIEEKRNIIKKMSDSILIFFRKFVNMIKKAFAKVVVALSSNDKKLKQLKNKVSKLEKETYSIDKNYISDIFFDYTLYVNKKTAYITMYNYMKDFFDNDSKVLDKVNGVIDNNNSAGVVHNELFDTFYDVINGYIDEKVKETKEDFKNGLFNVITYNGSRAKILISKNIGIEDKQDVYVLNVSFNEKGLNNDAVFEKGKYIEIIEKATSSMKTIKKDIDKVFKYSNKALDDIKKISKKADKDDNYDSLEVKAKLKIKKIVGTLPYTIIMDRYKLIREVIIIGSKTLDAIKEIKNKSN